jgi:hypothetical protein
MVAAFVGNLVLWKQPLYAWLLAGQAAFYALASRRLESFAPAGAAPAILLLHDQCIALRMVVLSNLEAERFFRLQPGLV